MLSHSVSQPVASVQSFAQLDALSQLHFAPWHGVRFERSRPPPPPVPELPPAPLEPPPPHAKSSEPTPTAPQTRRYLMKHP